MHLTASANLVSHRIARSREDNGAATVDEEGVARRQLCCVSLLVLQVQLSYKTLAVNT